jgi:hypothetical protein
MFADSIVCSLDEESKYSDRKDLASRVSHGTQCNCGRNSSAHNCDQHKGVIDPEDSQHHCSNIGAE